MVGAKTIKPSFKKKNRKCNKKENQIIVLNTHEPIIELELFNRCQEIRKKHLDRQLKYDNIYKGLVHCGECGKICNLKHREKENKNGSKSEIFSFVCSEANKGLTKKCDNTKSISAKKLDSLILPILEKQCKAISINDKDIKEIVTTINTNFNFEINRLKEEKKQYVQNIENIKRIGDLVEATNSAEIYNPKTGLSRRISNMKKARINSTAITLDDGRVLIYDRKNGVELYIPQKSEKSKYVGWVLTQQ